MLKESKLLSKKEADRVVKLGKTIRRLREEKELTLEDMEELGYPSWRHFLAVELGKKNITITTLFRIAEVLGVTPEKLISDLK